MTHSDLGDLVHHALQALQDCLPNDIELSLNNTEISIVGAGQSFTVLDDVAVRMCLLFVSECCRSSSTLPALTRVHALLNPPLSPLPKLWSSKFESLVCMHIH